MPSLVSILIPAYNSARWLPETLTSALAQTWPRTEIIIVDDGSKDETLAIAKTFERANVKVVSQENTGAPGARNHALELAQGDYIQWLDADDVLHPEKIARQLARAEACGGERTLLTCSWGKFFFRTSKARFVPDELWCDHGPADWIMARFNHNVWMNPAVWLVSRQLTELAGPWDSRLAKSGDDDGEYVCRLAAVSDAVAFVEDARCYYRIGTVGSLNWNMETNEQALESLLLSLRLATRTLLDLENSDRARRAALSHLQTFSAYFYASGEHYHKQLSSLAHEYGGEITPPRAGWKYYPVEVLLGPRVAKGVIRNWRAAKMLARGRLDWYLHRAGI